MPTNLTFTGKLVYPEFSYIITGLCFQVHNELGRFAREKQYANLLADKLKEKRIEYKREVKIGESGNIADFVLDGKVLLELKAKPFVTKEDYYQIQRYLHHLQLRLGIIVNFRSQFLKPKRVLLKEVNYK